MLEKIVVGPIMTNCYVVFDGKQNAVVIDPGFEGERIWQYLQENKLTVLYILLTHAHFDHVQALQFLKDKTDAPIAVHAMDAPYLTQPNLLFPSYPSLCKVQPAADILLQDGEILTAGDLTIEVIFTPGHTPGGVCYRIGDDVFVGDTLFWENIGRCDLQGGDLPQLISSIRQNLLCLPDRCKVYPGHGDLTTIGHEREYNPYLS